MSTFIEALESRQLLSASTLASVRSGVSAPALISAPSARKPAAPAVNLVGTWVGSYSSSYNTSGQIAFAIVIQTAKTSTGLIYIDGVPYKGIMAATTGANGSFKVESHAPGFWGAVSGNVVGAVVNNGTFTFKIAGGPIYSGQMTASRV